MFVIALFLYFILFSSPSVPFIRLIWSFGLNMAWDNKIDHDTLPALTMSVLFCSLTFSPLHLYVCSFLLLSLFSFMPVSGI